MEGWPEEKMEEGMEIEMDKWMDARMGETGGNE